MIHSTFYIRLQTPPVHNQTSHSFIEEFQGCIFGLNRPPCGGLPILIAIALIREYRVELDIFDSPVRRIMDPDMNKPSTFFIIYGGDPDLPKNNSSIRGWSTSTKDEIVRDSEVYQLCIGEVPGTRPHLGFVYIPMMTRLHDFSLDMVSNDIKSLNGFFRRCMRCVQGDYFCCCHVYVPTQVVFMCALEFVKGKMEILETEMVITAPILVEQ